jgi:hypothetical protein
MAVHMPVPFTRSVGVQKPLLAYLLIGIETRGRTIEEIDATLTRSKPLAALPHN